MTAKELADLRTRAERSDFTETYRAEDRGGLTPVKTPFYMLLLPSDVRNALAAAQQEARAAALEERDREWRAAVKPLYCEYCAPMDGPPSLQPSCPECAPLRALLEGK